MLRTWLNNAVEDGAAELRRACRAVLEWGGVLNGNISAVDQLVRQGRLVQYLRRVRNAMSLNAADLDRLSAVKRQTSGFTKIYALLSADGLPIYDSRVAAAIATLEFSFLQANRDIARRNNNLNFQLVRFRPGHVRNPDNRGFANTQRWTQAQVKLGWIMEEILRNTQLFGEQNPLAQRMRAMEAGLFMIGYDVRSLLGWPDAMMTGALHRPYT